MVTVPAPAPPFSKVPPLSMIAAKAGDDGGAVGNSLKPYVLLFPEVTTKEMMPSPPPLLELDVTLLKVTPSAVSDEPAPVLDKSASRWMPLVTRLLSPVIPVAGPQTMVLAGGGTADKSNTEIAPRTV